MRPTRFMTGPVCPWLSLVLRPGRRWPCLLVSVRNRFRKCKYWTRRPINLRGSGRTRLGRHAGPTGAARHSSDGCARRRRRRGSASRTVGKAGAVDTKTPPRRIGGAEEFVMTAPTPNFRPRNGELKVEPALPLFRFPAASEPPISDTVAQRSPSPKGRPVGPRAERSDGINGLHFPTAPSVNTSAGVLLSSAVCLLSLL